MSTKTLLRLYIEGETATEADVLAGAEGKLVTADVIAPLLGEAVPNDLVQTAVDNYLDANPGLGDVSGPAASANNEIALFSGTGGKTLKRGVVVGDAAGKNVGTTTGTVADGETTDARLSALESAEVSLRGEEGEPASTLLIRKFGNKFDPTDPEWGAVAGGKTGDADDDLAIALANQVAFQVCANAFKTAVLAGDRRATFVLPGKDFLIATAPYIGSSPPSLGVSAVGGGHWRGTTSLPLSSGWSCHGVVFDGLTGGRFVGDGGRLIRIENDPYNTETGADDTNSTILIVRSNDWVMEGFWDHEGFQNDSTDAATAPNCGNFIDVSYGCRQFSIPALIRSWKHQQALSIGTNRASGFTDDPGQSGHDILQPCTEWEVGDVEAYVGNHAVLVNVADQWSIRSIRHGFKPYTYGGVEQGSYVQRSLYLLGCGKGEVGRLQSNVGQKVQLLASIYPSSRSYKNTDVHIGVVDLIATTNQDSDFHTAVEINDHNTSSGTLRTAALTIGHLKAHGHKVGVNYRDEGASALTGVSILKRLEIATLDIRATNSGINVAPYGGATNVKLGKGSVDVRADADYSATSVPVQGVKIASVKGATDGASATDFITGVTIGQLDVVSGNRTCLLQAVNGLTITGANFSYEAQGVSGAQTYDLRVDYCKNYGPISYRLGAGGPPTQTSINEVMPTPIKGRLTRTESRDPGAIAAGGQQSSARTVTGARSGMAVIVHITNPPTGIMATGSITADNTVTVVTRNVGTSTSSAGALDYVITVLAV